SMAEFPKPWLSAPGGTSGQPSAFRSKRPAPTLSRARAQGCNRKSCVRRGLIVSDLWRDFLPASLVDPVQWRAQPDPHDLFSIISCNTVSAVSADHAGARGEQPYVYLRHRQ